MGTWSTDTFGNDSAGDWSYGLDDRDDLSLVRETFGQALEEAELDADTASAALAACEVLARLKGHWGVRDPYSETVDRWVEAHPAQPPAELIATALNVIDKALEPDSELCQLWSEEENGPEWREKVADLRRRVAAT